MTAYQYGSGFFWEVQGLLVCPSCQGDPKKMQKHKCPPEGEWHGIYFVNSEEAAKRRLTRLIDDVSSFTDQYEDYRIAQPVTNKPKVKADTPWKCVEIVFTEVPNIVFGRHIGEAVAVGWTTCSACLQSVKNCECSNGPVMSDWLKQKIEEWHMSPEELGGPAEDDEPPAKPTKKAKKGKGKR